MKWTLSTFIISCLLFAGGCSGGAGGAVAALSEIKGDAVIDLIDREDITVCRFSYDNPDFAPAVTISDDSLSFLLDILCNTKIKDGMIEGYKKSKRYLEYAVATATLDTGVVFTFEDHHGWKLRYVTYMDEIFDIPMRDYSSPSIIGFLSRFENDRQFRATHLADTVTGRDYSLPPISYDVPYQPAYNIYPQTVWDKDKLAELLDHYCMPEVRNKFEEQFWMATPDMAILMLFNDQMKRGAAFTFDKIGDEWFLKNFTASTEEHPSQNSIYEDALMQSDLPKNSSPSIRLDQAH